jgi:hypothetical protein
MEWLGDWLAKAQYGTVPAWFGGLSLVLALILFFRDRRRDEREQIDKTAVWVTADWDPTLALREPNRTVEPTEEISYQIFAKNSNDVPVEIGHAAFVVETGWWVRNNELSSILTRGTESSRLFQSAYLLAPGEQREQPARKFYVATRLPSGRTGWQCRQTGSGAESRGSSPPTMRDDGGRSARVRARAPVVSVGTVTAAPGTREIGRIPSSTPFAANLRELIPAQGARLLPRPRPPGARAASAARCGLSQRPSGRSA